MPLQSPLTAAVVMVACFVSAPAGADPLVLSTCAGREALEVPACKAAPGQRAEGWLAQTRSEVMARHGMVSTSQPLAAQAGLQMLLRGGTAIDAAIAAAAVLNVVEPHSAGIGGDLFAIAYLAAERQLVGLNASGWAASGATPARLQQLGYNAGTGMPQFGIWSVTVPGAVDGWALLLKRAGRLPLKEVLQPAIALAEEGFPWSERIAYDVAEAYSGNPAIRTDPDTLATYYPSGHMPVAGAVFRNRALARALRVLASQGRDAVYKGEIARAIVAKSTALGGSLTAEDLAADHAEWVRPLSTNYHGYDVYELPPNGQGFAVLEELNLLEVCLAAQAQKLAELGPVAPLYWHYLVEAKKLAFADLARYNGDPRYSNVPVERLLSKEYARTLCSRIDPQRATAPAQAPEPGGGTVYITTADRFGNMVSLIYSVYEHMGSGITVPGYGFLLHDRGALFSLDAASPNVIAPRKRPFHTLIPGFVMQGGRPLLSFGLMGGAMQAQGHLQVLINLIDLGANVQAAGDAARFQHFQNSNRLTLETPLFERVGAGLQALGHRVEAVDGEQMGGYQAILYLPSDAASAAAAGAPMPSIAGIFRAGSDRRRDGQAVGW